MARKKAAPKRHYGTPVTPFRFTATDLEAIDLLQANRELPSRAEAIRVAVAEANAKDRRKKSRKNSREGP
jgi:hypothetical protein